ncbi:MAG: tetratricopeptide repeat protein [Methylococcaceae bacterium]
MGGCSTIMGTQAPAPVIGGHAQMPKKPTVNTAGAAAKSTTKQEQIVTVTPIEEDSPPSAVAIELSPTIAQPGNTEAVNPAVPAEESTPFTLATPPSQPAEAVQQLEVLAAYKPLTPFSPAIGSLLASAETSSQSGSLDTAAASIERAIRIEPRNAALLYKLAEIRIKQNKPRIAEDLTQKALLLAAKDNRLKKQCWLLIGNARVMQNNVAGAKAARAKANSL